MMTRSGPSTEAVLYARVSSKDQEREGFSIPAQLKLLRQYADDQRLTIVQEFVDVETAKATGRTGFGAMLAMLTAHPSCSTILVEKTDRLYRNIRDWITVDELDLAVHFVKENVVVSPASRSSEKFMHGIKVLMAKNYVDNLSEEVKKGMREKAAQGHWPSVAPIGYVNDPQTRRIAVDAVRGPLITQVFALYAAGAHSLKGLAVEAFAMGLTHPRSGRRMMQGEIHRILKNPIYSGAFVWLDTRYQGAHTPLVTPETFTQVQAVLHRKPRARYPKQQHAFMGLLTCARCGCAMTAEQKKGRYVYYRCTGYHGACGNTYMREERLSVLLGTLLTPLTITPAIAEDIATALRVSDTDGQRQRLDALTQVEQRHHAVTVKLDRGYEDYVSGRISDEFWARKSQAWEAELQVVRAERHRVTQPRQGRTATALQILELAKQAEYLYSTQSATEQRRVLDTVLSNCTFDRGTLCPTYSKPIDLLVRGNETGDWCARKDSNLRPPA